MTVIPAERLRPIIERYVAENGGALNNKVHGSLPRRIYRMLNETETVSLATADQLLVDLGAVEEWHGELADLYEDNAEGPLERAVPRRLPPEKLRAAMTLYRAGMTPQEIAAPIWQRYGYASEDACVQSLQCALANMGLRRSIAEAKYTKLSRRRCRCGVSMDERSAGCQPCNSRHHLRKTRGTGVALPAPALIEPKCVACGADWSERTYACKNCIDRHSHRRTRGRKRASAAPPPAPRTADTTRRGHHPC